MEQNKLVNRVLKGTASSAGETKVSAPSSSGKNILLSTECIEHLNYRILQEELSSRTYLAMSLWLNNTGYLNAAKLWRKYSEEEMSHAEWAREYLLSMGIQPSVPELPKPNESFTGLPQIIRDSYQHEIDITMQIKELADHAFKMGDHMLYQLTLQYLKEQVEEHDKMQNLVDQLVAFGEDKIAMRLLDHELKDYL